MNLPRIATYLLLAFLSSGAALSAAGEWRLSGRGRPAAVGRDLYPEDGFFRPRSAPFFGFPPRSEATFPFKTGDSWNVNIVSRWPSGWCRGVAVRGDTAFVADGSQLEIIDCSDPSSPRRIGRVLLLSAAFDVSLSGHYAYVSGGYDGLFIVDISDPARPVLVGSHPPREFAARTTVDGNIAFICEFGTAYGGGGLTMLDVTDRTHPVQVGSFEFSFNAYDLVVRDTLAYMARDIDGLMVLDISDPIHPVVLGKRWYGASDLRDLDLAGDYVYGAYYLGGLVIFDVGDPYNPTIAGHFQTQSYAMGVAVSDSVCYVADGWDGLRVIDVSDPANPVEIGFVDTPGYAEGVAFSDGYAYVADRDGGLIIVDLRNPSSPVIVGRYDTGGLSMGVAVAPGYAYLAGNRDGLEVIDLFSSAEPVRIATSHYIYKDWEIDLGFGYAYLVNRHGLRVVDISDPSHPLHTAYLSVEPYFGMELKVRGNLVYFVMEDGLMIVDVSDPYHPQQVGFVNTFYAVGVDVAGAYAYVADWYEGLRIVDVSDPTSPTLVGSLPTQCARAVCVQNDRAYVADTGQLRIVDVSDPTSPVQVDSIATAAYYVRVAGKYAYVTVPWDGLHIFDISIPAPVEVGYFHTWYPRDIYIDGSRVYLADKYLGLFILDFTPGGVPTLLEDLEVVSGSEGVSLRWELSDEEGLREFLVYRQAPGDGEGEPSRVATLRGTVPADGRREYRWIDREIRAGLRYRYTLAARTDSGGEVILGSREVTTPRWGRPVLYPNVPNPFKSSTTIAVSLARPSEVELAVFDLRGRRVATLYRGRLEAGLSRFDWDGKDERGRPVAQGVYMYRLEAGKSVLARKMMLLR